MNQNESVDRVLYLLGLGMILCSFAVFASDIWFKDDAQMFQVFSNLLAGFSGSFFTRLKPRDPSPSVPISPQSTIDVSATMHQPPSAVPAENQK